jgi:Putative DNA-binding domain
VNLFFQSVKDFTDHLADRLSKRPGRIKGALVRVALFRQNGNLRFGSGLALFCSESLEVRAGADYGDLVLTETWIAGVVEVVDYLGRFLEGKLEIGTPTAVKFSGTNHYFQPYLVYTHTGWAEEKYTTPAVVTDPFQISQEPLTRLGLRPYLRQGHAVAHWMVGKTDWQSNSGPNDGQFVTVLPSTEGRIVKAKWTPGKLTTELEIYSSNSELQILFDRSAALASLIPAKTGVIEVEVPDDAQGIFLNLQGSQNDSLGRIHLSSVYDNYGPQLTQQTGERLAIEELKSGENESVEFKPFIAPNNEKENDLLETVIAFANTNGGRIYIGATDNAELEGYRGLHRAFSGMSDPCNALTARLRRLLIEKTKPVPKYKIEVLDIGGDPLVVLTVEKGSDPPYATHDNKVWVRKGATDRTPDPKTEFPQSQDESDPFRFRWR